MIGIFEGKQKKYNTLTLEALATQGKLTAWEIAKQIAPKIKIEGDLYHKTQKIYSVLIRKNGRLEDLATKGYIMLNEENKKWDLSAKGAFAILIEKKDIEKRMHPNHFKISNFFPINKKQIPKTIDFPLLGITINSEKYVNSINKMQKGAMDKQFRNRVLKEIEALLEEGINLDRISEKNLYALLLSRLQNKAYRTPTIF